MKKIVKITALFLLLVFLAGTFYGCSRDYRQMKYYKRDVKRGLAK
jgi:hypothetical protein